MEVVVLVPRRADGGHRDRLWEFVRQRWATDFPDWPVVEGHHDNGLFNRSAAINRAAKQAGAWDVAVITDSDIIGNPGAVVDAVAKAYGTGRMTVTHTKRVDLSRQGTEKVMTGYRGPWDRRPIMERVWKVSDSSCIAVPRSLFDKVGGFPEEFEGWGYEDSAFVTLCERAAGPVVRLPGTVFHLWHERPADGARNSPSRAANLALLERLRTRPAISCIPRIIHRTVPAETTEQVEGWWEQFRTIHPGWDLRTHRDPMNPADWPLTGDLWARCGSGAQRAGLIRLEALYTHGGVYVDSDIEPFRSFEPLMHAEAFAGWEDETTVPDFLLACVPGHPAFGLMIEKARAVIEGGGDAYQSGPAVSTEVLPNRTDVLLLPPGAFAPYHYLEKSKRASITENPPPFAFCAHHWHHSWGTAESKRSIERRQR